MLYKTVVLAALIFFTILPSRSFWGSRFRESENIKRTTTLNDPNESDHKYYVSVSNVKYSKKAGAMQMVTRFFIDDLERVLNARNVKQVTLGEKDEIENHYDAIQKYLDLKLVTEINGQKVQSKLLGAEYEIDQIALYIEFTPTAQPITVTMEFSAFYEVFEEQKNLIHFKINDQRKTMILERALPESTLNF